MSRYTTEHKSDTRERILKAAAKEFRSKGRAGATVPGIMETAGLTVGGFYKHFDSKAELFAEMFRRTFRKSTDNSQALREQVGEESWWEAMAETYLSPVHKKNMRGGCAMAALASDMPRADVEAKQAYEDELLRFVEMLTDGETEHSREEAWSFQALMLGGLIMARGMESEGTALEILRACRKTAAEMGTS